MALNHNMLHNLHKTSKKARLVEYFTNLRRRESVKIVNLFLYVTDVERIYKQYKFILKKHF